MKTLVIEDSRSSLNLLCGHIQRMGITPIPAETGATGIDLFLKERPDLILLDIVMPDIDGFEVARQIRQLEAPGDWAPIIFLSSLSKDKDIEKGIAAGGDDYLLKVRVPDMEAYRTFLGAVLSGIPGIRETHSYPVMEEVKDSGTLSLGHLQAQT